MNLKQKHRIFSRMALALAGVMIWDAVSPTVTLALTGGPSQPEFSSFEPVATTNMVNEFSGDFTYNIPIITIPGANNGGYAMSLSYHSGASPEEEASWVGYGWTLNPGAINRSKRGYPDDSKGDHVTFWNKTIPNRTASVGGAVSLEAFSFGDASFPGSVNASLRYNNYKGFGLTAGVGLSFANGLVSLGYSVSDGEGSFSVKISPAAALSYLKSKDTKETENKPATKATKKKELPQKKYGSTKDREAATKASRQSGQFSGIGALSLIGSNYGLVSQSDAVRNANSVAYTGASYNFTASILAALTPLQVGPTFDLFGSYSYQDNVSSNTLNSYGYMYSASANPSTGSTDMMDYYVEKANPYDKRDKYLGIPFNNADNFMVTGEGLGGGFRLHQNKEGHFHPNAVSSKINIVNVGAEIEAGPLDIGGGADLGVGFQSLSVSNWNNLTNFSNSGDEPYFFRFNNDAGGYVNFGSDGLQQASMSGGGVPGAKHFDPVVSGITDNMNAGSRSARSSYIAYHTNTEMASATIVGADTMKYKSYTLASDINRAVTRSSVPDGIGEFSVYNEDGARYTYGLPVYSRNELSMQYDLDGVGASSISHNYIAYKNISSNKSQIGEERPAPYASSYLLSEIVSPDYVDRTMNGATDDDFGGYTRFKYKRYYGSNDKVNGASSDWYKWRIPYTGLLYNKGELSTPMDDMGSVTYGEKEIYYLDTIVTKTHYAVFYTSNRTSDGLESKDNATAANSPSAVGTNGMQKLDSIKIFVKGPTTPSNDKLIKTVRFEYYSGSNSLCQGVPNGGGGKLTLKRIWFEYDGIVPAKISPYVFSYTYSNATYPSKYSGSNSIQSFNSRFTAARQNPHYTPFELDPWGNYQDSSVANTRFDNMQNWVNEAPDTTKFDPAAWQLKVIKLPTGGEIHVQYEQDDYSYVQDKPAEAMMSLLTPASDDEVDNNPAVYYLNTADLGITSPADKQLLANKIKELYVTPGKKMYFKFLYKLIGTASSNSLSSCSSEYIKGYCTVESVSYDALTDKVHVVLRENHGSCGKRFLPRHVCIDYVKANRSGSLNSSGNCNADAVGIQYNSPKQVVLELMNFLTQKLLPGNGELCTKINYPLSYLRVPIPVTSSAIKGKKGGGLRVKRLLLYDKGIETGDASLFGSEYVYKLPDGSSSGVATNEPSSIREENALVTFDPKDKAGFLCKLIAGKDKEEHELPLGESILPAPAVGYSRVLVKNIHSGITNTGFVVKEYYTSKDYPMTVDYTGIQTEKDFLPIPGGLINYFTSNLWTTQGFVFKQNNMNGQPRSETTYAGDPSNMNQAVMSSQQVFNYYQPGEQIPVMNSLNNVSMEDMGKESDITFESRKVSDNSLNLALEFDLDVGIFGIIPLPELSGFPSFTYTESQLCTHTTNKVITYPAIQKSVVSYADGIYHTSQNIAFNPHTGKPMVVRTTDGYDKMNLALSANHNGAYEAYTFPASQQYKDMGQKAKNERKIYPYTIGITLQHSGGKYWLQFPSGTCPFSECSGDLIKVYDTFSPTPHIGIFHTTDSISGNNLYIEPTAAFGSPSSYLTNATVSIEILRSGCTNQLNTNIGGFTTYADTTTSTIANSEATVRANFVAQLNAALPVGTISKNSLDSNVKIIDNTGHCASLKNSIMASGGLITLYTSLGIERMVIKTGSGCDTSCCTGCRYYECELMQLGNIGGHFILDPSSLEVYYSISGSSSSCNEPIHCLDLCPNTGVIQKVNVVAANAQSYSDNWPYDANLYAQVSGSNNYENGTKGKWRVKSNFVYRDTITGANGSSQRNYKNAGVFALEVFNWQDSTQNDTTKWIKTSTVTKYSPDGNALEEKDIMNIYSTAKFGYNGTQPYLVAKNADYQSVQFDGFENAYNSNTKLEDGWTPANIATHRTADTAHSGNYSWALQGSDSISLKNLNLTQHIKSNGLFVKVWVRDRSSSPTQAVKIPMILGSTYHGNTNVTQVARTGEWTLYQCYLDPTVFSSGTIGNLIQLHIINNYPGTKLLIDDVRVQPYDAQMIAYVYDLNSLRLITTFDDQHFGLYYQYNAEGKLVRKMKETERGMKTITETQYHTPQVVR